jgi:hypothetical protein
MPEIKVTANVSDALKGFKAMDAELEKLRQKAAQVSHELQGIRLPDGTSLSGGMVNRNPSGNIQPVAAPSGSGLVHQPSAMSQQHRMSFGRSGQQYNLNNPTGVMEYYENVLAQANPMIRNLQAGSIASRFGMKYQGYQTVTSTTKPTRTEIATWFAKLNSNLSNMDKQTRAAYQEALMESANSRAALPTAVREFANTYGAKLGAPQTTKTTSVVPQSRMSRFGQHFASNMKGHSIGGALLSGLKGGIGGSLIDMAAGGGAAGSLAGSLGAGAIGMAGGPIGAIAAVAIQQIMGTIGNGIKTYQQTVPQFSALSHALDNAKNNVNSFRHATQMAGASMGMSAQASTQAAMTLTQAFGASVGGTQGITSLVGQAGRFGLMNGISPTTMASMMSTAGALGITNGKGASMNSQSFNEMLLNMTQLSHMQGRQQNLYTGLLGVYNGLGSVNPIISSANSTAAIYTAMNGTGIQGLQGQRGANLLSQMNSTLGSGKGLAGIMGMAAIYQASGGKVTNPWQMMSIEEQGLGAGIGNTTYGAQLQKMVQQMAPGNMYTQAGILSSVAGISVNQAMAMLKSGAMGAQHISTSSNQTTTMSLSDQNSAAAAIANVTASEAGYGAALLKNVPAKGIGVAQQVGVNGAFGGYKTIFGPQKAVSDPPNMSPTQQANIIKMFNTNGQSGASLYNKTYALAQGILNQESGGYQYAINDNSAGKPGVGVSYRPKSKAEYLALANKLLGEGHQLAMGPFQIESFHGITPAQAANYSTASKEAMNILMSDYRNSGGNWTKALSEYGGYTSSTSPYATSVEAYASNYVANQGHNANPLNLSQSSIQEVGNAVAQALQKYGLLSGGKGPSN